MYEDEVFIEFDAEDAFHIVGAKSGMGLDHDGKPYGVLLIRGFTEDDKDILFDIPIIFPPSIQHELLRVINSLDSV